MATAVTAQRSFTPRSKDTSTLYPVTTPIPYSALCSILLSEEPATSPKDNGKVSLIVERPSINTRNIVTTTLLHPTTGMQNSGWEERPQRGTQDQICVMSTTAIRAITGSEDHDAWAAAGDQFFFDFDLSAGNLKTGDLLQVGECVLRVTEKPHTGCGKFSKRFGVDALRAVSGKLAKERRLRGIYFCVVQGGVVNEGDSIVKIDDDHADENP